MHRYCIICTGKSLPWIAPNALQTQPRNEHRTALLQPNDCEHRDTVCDLDEKNKLWKARAELCCGANIACVHATALVSVCVNARHTQTHTLELMTLRPRTTWRTFNPNIFQGNIFSTFLFRCHCNRSALLCAEKWHNAFISVCIHINIVHTYTMKAKLIGYIP